MQSNSLRVVLFLVLVQLTPPSLVSRATIWVGVLGLSLMATGLVLQGVRSLLRHLIVEHFGID